MDSNSQVCPCPCGQDELKWCECGRGYCRNKFKKDGKYWVCPLKGKGTNGCSFEELVVRQPPPATMGISIATTSQRATDTPPTTSQRATDTPPTTPFHPSTPPTTPYGSSTPTTTEEKRIKALARALEISQTANRALMGVIHDLAKLPLDDK